MSGGAGGLSALWDAGSVAVIGATDRAGALGRLPIEFLLRYGYTGRIVPIRPDGAPVCDLPSYPSVTQAPGPVDLAMVMVSASNVAGALRDCAAAGVRVAVICTSGFAETGTDGAALQDEVVSIAREAGLRVVGPNCIGTVGVATGQVSSFSPLFSGTDTTLVPGTVGFVSQSGALGYGAVSLAFERGLGLGWVVNTGNEADVSATEVMAEMGAQPECSGVLAYVESLTSMADLRRIGGSGTPTAILKAGRSASGSRAAASHTGALAAPDRVVDAALRQLGIVRVSDVEELLDVGAVMTVRPPAGPRVAVVTTSGGSGILAADEIELTGLRLAELAQQSRQELDSIIPAFGSSANPVDVTASVMSNGALFDRALAALADDPNVDMVLACFCVLTGKDVDDVVDALARVAARSGKPVVAARTGADHLAPHADARMRQAGIPAYPTPARAVRALSALWQFGRQTTAPSTDDAVEPVAMPDAGATEPEIKSLLAKAGLPVPVGRFAHSPQDALEAVAECHGSAVFKAVVPGLLHKSDAGGVIVGVSSAGADDAFRRVHQLGGRVWVEECVPAGVEALVGFAPSPLGTVLTVGIGGTLAEVIDDVAIRVLPVTLSDVDEMVDETRLSVLIDGARGAEPGDRTAFVDCVYQLAGAVAEWDEGFELDLNPIVVLPSGVRILDAAYRAPSVEPELERAQ